MKRIFTFCLVLFSAVMTLSAQQTIHHRSSTFSPELLADGRVAFRLNAPNAQSVELTGDMLPEQEITTEH